MDCDEQAIAQRYENIGIDAGADGRIDGLRKYARIDRRFFAWRQDGRAR
jgi:hypothetical protein